MHGKTKTACRKRQTVFLCLCTTKSIWALFCGKLAQYTELYSDKFRLICARSYSVMVFAFCSEKVRLPI